MSKTSVSRDAVLRELRRLLSEAFDTQHRGANHARLGRSFGYIDGYMRGLIDSGLASERELLELVAAERARHAGPATKQLAPRAAW